MFNYSVHACVELLFRKIHVSVYKEHPHELNILFFFKQRQDRGQQQAINLDDAIIDLDEVPLLPLEQQQPATIFLESNNDKVT